MPLRLSRHGPVAEDRHGGASAASTATDTVEDLPARHHHDLRERQAALDRFLFKEPAATRGPLPRRDADRCLPEAATLLVGAVLFYARPRTSSPGALRLRLRAEPANKVLLVGVSGAREGQAEAGRRGGCGSGLRARLCPQSASGRLARRQIERGGARGPGSTSLFRTRITPAFYPNAWTASSARGWRISPHHHHRQRLQGRLVAVAERLAASCAKTIEIMRHAEGIRPHGSFNEGIDLARATIS